MYGGGSDDPAAGIGCSRVAVATSIQEVEHRHAIHPQTDWAKPGGSFGRGSRERARELYLKVLICREVAEHSSGLQRIEPRSHDVAREPAGVHVQRSI